ADLASEETSARGLMRLLAITAGGEFHPALRTPAPRPSGADSRSAGESAFASLDERCAGDRKRRARHAKPTGFLAAASSRQAKNLGHAPGGFTAAGRVELWGTHGRSPRTALAVTRRTPRSSRHSACAPSRQALRRSITRRGPRQRFCASTL